MSYRTLKRYIARYKGEKGGLKDFNTIEEAQEAIKRWKEEDKIDREMFFYEIYDTHKKEVVG